MNNRHYQSNNGIDKIISQICKDKGVFIDIDVSDGIDNSSSYYLEKILDWDGVITEGSQEKYTHAIKNRWCKNFNGFVSNKNGFINNTPSITLNSLFEMFGLNKIDYLNINKDNWREILSAFDYKKYLIKIISVEDVKDFEWFKQNGYSLFQQQNKTSIYIKNE